MTNSDNDSKLFYKEVYFDLPFLILVKDGLQDISLEKWAEAYIKGEKLPFSPYAPASNEPGYLALGGGLPIYIPDSIEPEAYVVHLSDEKLTVGIQFLKRINQKNTTKSFGEVFGDRTGRSSYSSVRVNFDLSLIKEEFHWKMELFCNLAIKATNLFLENYRVINNRYYISKITKSIIQNFTITNSFSNGDKKNQNFTYGSGSLYGFGNLLNNEQDLKLRTFLKKGNIPSILEILKLEVKNKLDLTEWRLASIESALLFETWIKIFLREQFSKLELVECEINEKFHRKDKNKTPHSTYYLAKELIKKTINFDFFDTIEFNEWSINTRDLRNDIIHGIRFEVTEKEAKLSFESVKKAIDLIEEKSKK